jgi:propanediol dehydratase small subunit
MTEVAFYDREHNRVAKMPFENAFAWTPIPEQACYLVFTDIRPYRKRDDELTTASTFVIWVLTGSVCAAWLAIMAAVCVDLWRVLA